MGQTHTPFQGFVYRTQVYIGDVSPFGQAYFVRYFEWQGRAREEFLRYLVPTWRWLLESFRIVTQEAAVTYRKEMGLHEGLSVEVRLGELTRASVRLRFSFRHDASGDVVADGHQRLVFTDQAGHIVPIPDDVQIYALAYLNLQALPVHPPNASDPPTS